MEIKAPTFPESVADGTVASWHKQPGDAVARDELVVEIETDKVVMEVVAPADGRLEAVLKGEGEVVQSEEVLARLEAGAGAPRSDGGRAAAGPGGATDSGPAASGDADHPARPGPAAAGAPAPGGDRIDVRAPTFPESVAEGTVASWHKQPGDAVARDELIVEIETDKVVMEVVAPADGRLAEVLKGEGEAVQSEELLARVEAGAAAEAPRAPAPERTPEPQRTPDRPVNPSARRLAAERGIDPARIRSEGGRVTKGDVLRHVAEAAEQASQPAPGAPARDDRGPVEPAPGPRPGGGTSNVVELAVGPGERPERRVPMTRLRASIARRLVQAQQTAAMLTTFNEVDMSGIMALRKRYQADFEKAHGGTRLGFMSFFVRASCEALKRFPAVNASIDENDIVYHGYYDVGVAVSTERGLVVPIIRDADGLSLAQIEDRIREYGTRAREGKLSIEEMSGGTFTISNGGIFGSLLSTPILNPPQTAILGMHKIQDRPMAVDGEVVVRPMMYLALSYDHRLIDGQEAVRFLVSIKESLEEPARLLLDL